MDEIDKKNIEPATVNSLYPTTNNSTNIFALLSTNNYDYHKKIIISNRTHKNIETVYSKPEIQLSKK